MLKMYMVYSRGAGPEEGAALAFAHNSQEARVVGWGGIVSDITDEFIDVASLRLRNKDWLYAEANQEKLKAEIPHHIDAPRSCSNCETWGESPIGDDGLCESCRAGE